MIDLSQQHTQGVAAGTDSLLIRPDDIPKAAYRSMIAVAGNLGSGKTTLTKNLASVLNWSVQPPRSYDLGYIEDQINEPERWTLEAQLAFLTHKVAAITQAVKRQESFVVDRSPYEDYRVFGAYWASLGYMDERCWTTFSAVAELLISQVPPPSALIYCEVPWRVSAERLLARPRSYQHKYPQDHLRRLQERYDAWVETIVDIPVLRVDTTVLDIRSSRAAHRVVRDLQELLSQLDKKDQPCLPSLEGGPPALARRRPVISRRARTTRTIFYSPSVYIAAGFTAHESAMVEQQGIQDRLPEVVLPISGIPTGHYREALLGLVQAFEDIGYQAFLPHRDINRWGARSMTPRQVADECIAKVAECELFMGVLGTSFGSHAEAATALALGKPTILVSLQGTEETFFGRGLRQSSRVISVEAPSMEHLAKIIRSRDFISALDRARGLDGADA